MDTMRNPLILIPVAFMILTMAASPALADGQVRLELVGEARGSALVFQQWAQALSKAGIQNVRISAGKGSTQIGIVKQGTDARPTYVVTGLVKSQDELVLPGKTYRRRDVSRLALWLKDLARHGPDGPKRQTLEFGLTPEQMKQVRVDLSQSLGFSTKGMRRDTAVENLRRRLIFPVRIEPGLIRSLAEDTVSVELSGLSCGSALAYLLRPMGMCLVPGPGAKGPRYTVAMAKEGLKIWPIGSAPKKRKVDLLPPMFEMHNVNIQGVSAQQAIDAIGGRLKVPVLIDHNALARYGIDPSQIIVSYPNSRASYGRALDRVLFQALLKSELRVDEAGKPFLWITSLKAMKPG